HHPAASALFPLSLHDALPICVRLLAHGRTGSRRVRRADVEDGGEHGDERLADPRQLLDRDVRLVELPVAHALLDDALHEAADARSEEHTSELQSLTNLVCRLL